eukprot:TRINITY_DN5410_c0_g3_i2.p1 TRINITY_DN5410_c0_g3~~TRINITY_DN5410_c0_g3_i2.p1  ORF type:complete len:171 (+),score=39.22 TRINITY_DN5410_c0_g3_i2:430-942(+)
MPIDNKGAVLQEMQTCSTQIKDAYTELSELLASHPDTDDESDEFDLKLSEEDKVLVPKCIELVKLTYMIITQLFIKGVDGITSGGSSEKQTLDWLESMASIIFELSSTTDDLSESIYPPQDQILLKERFQKLKILTAEALNKIKGNPQISSTTKKLIPLVEQKLEAVALE